MDTARGLAPVPAEQGPTQTRYRCGREAGSQVLNADTDRARQAFIESRRVVVDSAELVAEGRRNGSLSVAALDRLVLDVDTYQAARRAFITLTPE